MEALRKDTGYTYADYCGWDDDQRWELIDGVAYAMSPGPSQAHQSVIGEIFAQLHAFLKDKPCDVFIAPFDVRLNAEGADNTVVQPDLMVVCDKSKLDGMRCNGAPDLVIEIVSPSSSGRDKVVKYNKYLAAGVKEYWLVDPDDKTVQVSLFSQNARMVPYGETDQVPVGVLPGCVIDLKTVFAE